MEEAKDHDVEQLLARESREIHPMEQILVSVQAIGAMIEAGQHQEIQSLAQIQEVVSKLIDLNNATLRAVAGLTDSQSQLTVAITLLLKGENE